MKIKKILIITLLATTICVFTKTTFASDSISVTHTQIPIIYNNGDVGDFMENIVYGNGIYVGIGIKNDINQRYVWTSKDLTEWEETDLILKPSRLSNLILIYNNGKFYLFEREYEEKSLEYISFNLYLSENGINWTKKDVKIPSFDYYITSIGYVNGIFYFVDGSCWVYYSEDGINWNKSDKALFPNIYGMISNYKIGDIAYGNGIYIAVAGDYLYRSSDLRKWYTVASPYHFQFQLVLEDTGPGISHHGGFENIAFGNDTFVVAPYEGKSIYVSKDNGITWNGVFVDKYNKDDSQGFRYLKFDNNAFYLQDREGNIYKSYDGIKWYKIYHSNNIEKIRNFFVANDKCIILSYVRNAYVLDVLETEDFDVYLEQAQVLNQFGLLKGTNNGFDLNRVPTRAESAVMLVRLLGKEQEALSSNYEHPFIDVPEWCDKYIGYLYENNLTQGIGDNKYGSSMPMDSKSYVTLILRVLGYDDKAKDFEWNTAIDKALEISLLSEEEANNLRKDVFLRSHMVGISYNALSTKLKNSSETLLDKLIDNDVIACDVFIIGGTNIKPISEEKIVQALSNEEIEKLKSYDYQFDLQYACDDLFAKDPDLANKIYSSFNEIITINKFERFYTNERLTYLTKEGFYGIRGIYQIHHSNGLIQETYKEFIFNCKIGSTRNGSTFKWNTSIGHNLLSKSVFKINK